MSDGLVMIVDDERGLLTLFGGLIKRLGCTVIEIDGGQKAIDTLREQTPDLLVLDLAMPEVSGQDVLAFVQSMPHLQDMRVIVLTALGVSASHHEELLHVNKWINKPVRPDVFLDIVREILDGTAD